MSISNVIFNVLSSALDILIVATLIYLFLKLVIKSEKHMPLLIGILTIISLFIVSIIFELTLTRMILEKILSWGVVIIVILFREEIKSYLESVGSGRFLFKNIDDSELKYIESLTNVVFKLGETKTGALITIKRQTSLHKYTQNAIKLEAEFSEYLLMSIFLKDSPLHDGAVVIEDERISYASTYFPIAIDIDIEKKFGTRHRAGVTITRETDAVSIIVSEENGNISLAFNGLLHTDVTQEFFRNFLNEKLIEE